jgi:hypothetical protein
MQSDPDYDMVMNALFEQAGRYLNKLGETFTTYAYIRLAAKDQQWAYINLLRYHISDKDPFAAANTAIETQLKQIAPNLGYIAAEEATLDTDMFGKLQKVALYRRVSDVIAANLPGDEQGT